MIFWAIIGTMFLGDALWWWRARRRLRRTWLRVAAAAFALAMAGGLAAIFLGRMQFLGEMPRPWASAILIWHLLVLPVLLTWMFGEVIVAAVRRVLRRHAPAQDCAATSSASAHCSQLTRREFFSAAAAFTPPFLTLGGSTAGEFQLDEFRVRRLIVSLPNLPPALDGLTIAHVTDTHVGRFTRDAVLGRIADTTNSLNADIIALTGDLINDSLRALPPALELVRALRAKHAVAACEGNHDLIEDARTFHREAERGGLPMLRDDAATITIRGQRVQLLGLPWRRGDRAHFEAAHSLLARRDPAAWALLLAHHPHAWDAAQGVPLTLAGHTHGGQLMLGSRGFGPAMYRYWSGLYTRGNEALVVSNGAGNWFPVRIHAPAEILHITLRGATVA